MFRYQIPRKGTILDIANCAHYVRASKNIFHAENSVSNQFYSHEDCHGLKKQFLKPSITFDFATNEPYPPSQTS